VSGLIDKYLAVGMGWTCVVRSQRLDRYVSWLQRETITQFLGFAGVGAVGTAAHYLVLIGLVQGSGTNAVPASVAGFVVGALVNYTLNYHVIFRSDKSHLTAASKFMAIALVGLLLNTAIVWFAVNTLGIHYLVSQILATALVLVWNYAGNRIWTFA
jgi:putative flippase GtrA